jgi:hypothetical protein
MLGVHIDRGESQVQKCGRIALRHDGFFLPVVQGDCEVDAFIVGAEQRGWGVCRRNRDFFGFQVNGELLSITLGKQVQASPQRYEMSLR